jgi:hypothetical protein
MNGGRGNQYTYDGFGNLTAKTVPQGASAGMQFTASYNAATNQQVGMTYDANGNSLIIEPRRPTPEPQAMGLFIPLWAKPMGESQHP